MGNSSSEDRRIINSLNRNQLQMLGRRMPQLAHFQYINQEVPIAQSHIDPEYQKYNKKYYDIVNRKSKRNKNMVIQQNVGQNQQKEYKIDVKNYQEKYTDFFIPNQHQEIEKIDFEAYNINASANGDIILITSRGGLDIYTQKTSDKYEFDQQVFPGTIQWTITDSDISRDGNYLIHSTLNQYISMYSIKDKKYVNNFSVSEQSEQDEYDWNYSTRCFSVKFNEDGTRFIASTGGNEQRKAELKVYDIRHQYILNSIPAHDDDINSITYLQRNNPNVIVSGADDSVIKIWDTRALQNSNRAQGYLLGHACGVTKVSSREDGFYLASNSKDQSLKIWDIRKASDTMDKPSVKSQYYYDYRGYKLDKRKVEQIKQMPQNRHFNNSVMSFYGHSVFRTLIRCHFSPQQVNGGRYVYTASGCGKIYIYDILEQKQVGILDSGSRDVLRDVLWHPNSHKIISSGWDGILSQWSFNPDYENPEIPQEQRQENNDNEGEENYLEEEEDEDYDESSQQDNIINRYHRIFGRSDEDEEDEQEGEVSRNEIDQEGEEDIGDQLEDLYYDETYNDESTAKLDSQTQNINSNMDSEDQTPQQQINSNNTNQLQCESHKSDDSQNEQFSQSQSQQSNNQQQQNIGQMQQEELNDGDNNNEDQKDDNEEQKQI